MTVAHHYVNVGIAFASFVDGVSVEYDRSISDTGVVYEWTGAAWQVISTGGAAHVTDPSLTLLKYASGGYTYLCEAEIGTARSTAAWRVTRITDATGDMVFAGTGLFAHAATDAATVAALTYTLGA